jgi:hypothetical protein
MAVLLPSWELKMRNIQSCLLILGSMVLSTSAWAATVIVTTTPPIAVLPFAYEYISCNLQNTSTKLATSAKIEIVQYDGTVLFTKLINPQTVPEGIAPGGTVFFYGGQPTDSNFVYCRFTTSNKKARGSAAIMETQLVNRPSGWSLKQLFEAR